MEMNEKQKQLWALLVDMSSQEIQPVVSGILSDYSDSVHDDTVRWLENCLGGVKEPITGYYITAECVNTGCQESGNDGSVMFCSYEEAEEEFHRVVNAVASEAGHRAYVKGHMTEYSHSIDNFYINQIYVYTPEYGYGTMY